MSENIAHIRLPIIKDYIKTIKSLAQSGRNNYQNYLLTPLTTWSQNVPGEALDYLLSLIDTEKGRQQSKLLPSLFKKAIIKSLSPDQLNLSLPGTICMQFLSEMQKKSELARSFEAVQFVNLLHDPFLLYQQQVYKVANQKFKTEISTAEVDEVKQLLDARNTQGKTDVDIKKLSEALIKKIKNEVRMGNMLQVKKDAISYLLRISSTKNPDLHREIFPLLDQIDSVSHGFLRDVMDTAAILIYHEIVKAIRSNDLRKALVFIAKYTLLFRGNPSTPNHYEVDMFEKEFFDIVDKRDLWDTLSSR